MLKRNPFEKLYPLSRVPRRIFLYNFRHAPRRLQTRIRIRFHSRLCFAAFRARLGAANLCGGSPRLSLRRARGCSPGPRGFAQGLRAGASAARASCFARDEFLRRAQTAREMFESHPETPALFAEALAAAGMERDKIFLDLPRLRIAPPVATHAGGIVSHIGPHRDTWGVGIQAQINWWGPVWALSKNRTMAFFPNHFRRALANTTATWSFAEYNAARKAATGGERPAYPAAPEPREAPDEAPVPVVIAPGDMLCFSAAHLHASVLNASNLTRFSLEIRSANPEDIRAGRGAPNADCETPRMALGLFRSPTGGGALSDFV